MEKCKYIINGKTYFQKPLVIGQVELLVKILEGRTVNDLSASGLVLSFGGILPKVAAIILIPEGEKISERDIEAIETELRDELTVEAALEVAADFLSCNPISLIFEQLRNLPAMLAEKIGTKGTGSTKS
jgi:hypothetical protein